jgi:DNA-binding MarR family transcriptional regulator
MPACTCFLLRRLTRKVTQAYDKAVAAAGLTITQYSLLAHLSRERGASVAALAERMGMERTTLLRTLQPVLAEGWARYGERAPGQSAALELTAKGRGRLRAARPLWERAQAELRTALGGAAGELQSALLSSLKAVEGRSL